MLPALLISWSVDLPNLGFNENSEFSPNFKKSDILSQLLRNQNFWYQFCMLCTDPFTDSVCYPLHWFSMLSPSLVQYAIPFTGSVCYVPPPSLIHYAIYQPLYWFCIVREVLQKFCVVDSFSSKSQQMDLKPKKLYSQVITYFSTKSLYLAMHFPYWTISLWVPVAYYRRSFFSTVYHFDVCHSYSSIPLWISVPIGSQLILW